MTLSPLISLPKISVGRSPFMKIRNSEVTNQRNPERMTCHQLGRAWTSGHSQTTEFYRKNPFLSICPLFSNFSLTFHTSIFTGIFWFFLAIETVSARVFDVCGTKVMHPVNHFLDDFLSKEHKIVVSRNRVYILYYDDSLSGVFSVEPINQNPEGNTESQKRSKKT